MANREGKCPKCGGALCIPEELETFSCMYCGAVLSQEELVIPHEGKEKSQAGELEEVLHKLWENGDSKAEELIGRMLELDEYNLKANQVYAQIHFSEILFRHKNAMEHFKRSEYPDYFDAYKIKCRPAVEAVDRYALEAEDHGEEFMRLLASNLMKDIHTEVESDQSLRSKNARALKCDQYKMILAVYTIPMILELRLGVSERLTDIMVEEWMRQYPKSILRKGTYSDMVTGFRKGKMCFITTAVCESFGKPDDCQELQSLRKFRDTYMMKSEDGRALVEEYYEVAPAIVTCMDMEEDRAGIYRSVWSTYLEPCLQDIAAGREEACEERYVEMVRSLEARYLDSRVREDHRGTDMGS
ncbi:hypothetical protein LQE92_01470 [Lacrimispora sp. NSJ-141]|uniref:TFIIB-type zinc ribbon-containing protein n=1 Tax=Lientehia hominis TaxID=2897778 RepID=A0AAP2RFZ8_9FIRM|nr:CFI-box-CTERM domain-containing protein [Lientehia hominis]MCD2491296.1 hypothetical protein [Lientehia hominis]